MNKQKINIIKLKDNGYKKWWVVGAKAKVIFERLLKPSNYFQTLIIKPHI